MSDSENLLNEAKNSLERVQSFDPKDLVQGERLGEASFGDAVEPAQKIIALFRQLPIETLNNLPEAELGLVKSQANGVYQIFQEILSFDVNEGDVRNRKVQYVEKLKTVYQSHFSKLYPLISYSMARTVNFNQLEETGRSAVQDVRDKTEKLMEEIDVTSRQVIWLFLEQLRLEFVPVFHGSQWCLAAKD